MFFLPPSFAQKYGQHLVSHDFPTSSHDFMARFFPFQWHSDRWCGGGRNERISFCCCSTPTSLGWGHLGDLGCGASAWNREDFGFSHQKWWYFIWFHGISWGYSGKYTILSGNMKQHEPRIIRNMIYVLLKSSGYLSFAHEGSIHLPSVYLGRL